VRTRTKTRTRDRKGMTPKSIFVRGYEIPVATPSNLRFYGALLAAPTLALVLSIWRAPAGVVPCVVWLLVAVSIFHLRNFVVRKEADQGIHDDLYGPHLMRMRQREFDERAPWFKNALVAAYALIVVTGIGLHAAGIDVLAMMAKSPMRPVITK
jgi:hypothetical protein